MNLLFIPGSLWLILKHLILQDLEATMEALWKKGYVLCTREPVEILIVLGGNVSPPMMLKELLGENKRKYIKMAKLESDCTQHIMCGCLTKSDTLLLLCIDNLQAGDCRSEG